MLYNKYMPPKNEKLVKFLNNLLKPAQANPVHKRFSKNEKYYNGMGAPTVGYSNNTDPIKGNNRNYYNVIRPIIETKATIALDIQVTTSVKPSSLSHANFDYIKELDSISEMLNDVLGKG